MSGENLSVYYHTHWDREWYLPFRAYQVRLAEVVDEVLDRLDKHELPCFTLDGQTVVLDDYLELRPENRERLQRYIKAGKLSIGPWYVMPDGFLVGGESLIRNLARGIRQAREWGYDRFTGYLPDTFGHSADMPTIFRGFGIDSAILWRGLNPPKSILNWRSPSGATVKTLHLTDGYFQMMLDDWTATPQEQIEALDKLVAKLEAASPQDGIGLMPLGADHMGPLPGEARQRLLAHYPKLKETTPDQFMASLDGLADLETVTGELMDNSGAFLLPGVWSSRMYLKQANRRLEHALTHRLEPLLAMTQVFLPEGAFRYPAQELDLAWKTLMLNHPHDSICGCSVDEVHRENMARFEQVEQLCEAMDIRTEQALLQLGTEDDWVVFNASDQPYTGPVVATVEENAQNSPPAIPPTTGYEVLQDDYLYDTHKIPLAHLTKYRLRGGIWVENVPAFGIKIIRKKERTNFEPVIAEGNRLENDKLIVIGEPDGTITVTDKTTGQTYSGLFKVQITEEEGDSYNSAPGHHQTPLIAKCAPWQATNYKPDPSSKPDPLYERLLSEFYEYEDMTNGLSCYFDFSTDEETPDSWLRRKHHAGLSLVSGSSVIRFGIGAPYSRTLVTYKYQVAFVTDAPIHKVSAESHLGIVDRFYDPNYRTQDHIPVDTMKELKTNTGPIQRFISANGQTWITEGLTEYEVYQNTLYLTLNREFRMLSDRRLETRGAPAGPPLHVHEAQCSWYQWPSWANSSLSFAWMPTPKEPHQLYSAASQFCGHVPERRDDRNNFSIWAKSGTGTKKSVQPNSLIAWDNPALVTSACYWLPGRGLVLRLINTADETVTTQLQPGFAVKAIHRINFLEEVQETLPGPTVTVSARDVVTLLFEV